MAAEPNAVELHKEPGELAPIENTNMLAVIARAAADPRVDVAKMSALIEMQIKIEQRQAEVEFNAALARLMPRLPRIEKNGTIPDNEGRIRSHFARFEDIDRVIRPLLADEGFSVSFRTEDPAPGFVKVIGTLAHRLGHSTQSSVTVPISAPPKATGTQAVGSSVSYGKRYVLVNMLNIVTVGEDNDGQGSEATISDEQALELETLLHDSGADVAAFLKWAGVGKIDEILAKNFGTAKQGLMAKMRKAKNNG